MNVICMILGGGAGSRLWPLTRDRAKPAVPIAGKYRLVDIPISNCLHSSFRQIYLLTQFNSVSLHQHVQSTYRFDQFNGGFVRILAAQQTPSSDAWFQGTADAVRQSLSFIMDQRPDLVVVLSGDQLYRMDLQEMVEQHLQNGSEITIATKPVKREEAGELGIMQIDGSQRITNFVEKPGTGPALDPLRAPLYSDERYLASMGIYVFNRNALVELLECPESDFGKNIIPSAIDNRVVCSYVYEGFWRDIGTIRSFWETNLSLTDDLPEFTFYDPSAPVYTRMRYLPPSKINKSAVDHCLLSEGCILSGGSVKQSVVGIRAVVGKGSEVSNVVLMGADYYDTAELRDGMPGVGIGKDCQVEKAIIDKNARIGDGCVISPEGKPDEMESELYVIRGGVIVIPKNTIIPPGTVI